MLSTNLKVPVTRLITPLCRALISMGITANMVTVFGALGSITASIVFIAQGKYLAGVLITTVLVLSDLLDGTMARLTNGGTKWGAVLDSTLDRITDAVLILSLAYHLHNIDDGLLPIAIIAMVLSLLVPYIRARAEALGIPCSVGVAERTERLVILLVGIGLAGLGLPYSLAVSVWLLALLSLVTVFQRLNAVRKFA